MNEEPRELSAGPMHLLLAGGDLRYLTVAREEVIRRIYGTVRDPSWDTLEPVISNLRVDQHADESGFQVEYDAGHKRGGIDFEWHATLAGRWELQGATAKVFVGFEMKGRANCTFKTNRTGICVLHPPPASEGVVPMCVVTHTDGFVTGERLPYRVQPNQPFTDIQSISHWPWPGREVLVTVKFSGDVFEMEDQRNWGDASYKTYSRPLSQPFPYTLEKGQEVTQSAVVEVTIRNFRPRAKHRRVLPREDRAGAVTVMGPLVARARGIGGLPGIGISRGPLQRELSTAERRRLRPLGLSHLRADLLETAAEPGTDVVRAVADAKALGVPLEVALHLRDGKSAFARRVAPLLREARVARFIAYEIGRPMASADAVASVRRDVSKLFPDVPIGAGTMANFVDLNRNRLAPTLLDVLAWPLNPQNHGTDDLTLLENLPAHCDTVATARSFAPDMLLSVGPVTMHHRCDPLLLCKGGKLEPGTPDPRQREDFGAAWTLGSLKYLVEAGADSVTYFDATGPFGVMDEKGPYPLYHVLADVLEFTGGDVLGTETTEPRWLCALTLRKRRRLRVLVANLLWRPQPVRLATIKNYYPTVAGQLPLEHVIPPYGVARFDFQAEPASSDDERDEDDED